MTVPAVAGETTLSQGLTLMAQLEQTGALTDTGLNLNGQPLSYDQLEALAAMFGRVNRISAWVIGDVIVEAELRFGELWPQIAAATGLKEQTAMNYASICRRVPHSRRRGELGITVHDAVAKLPPREQEQWLDHAVARDLSRSDLRSELREAGLETSRPTFRDLARRLVDSAALDGQHYVVPVPVFEELRSAL